MSDTQKRTIIDGCTAAAYVAYAMSDVATIYPITPIASMGETAQKWADQGRKNIFGQPMHIVEMESELGAAGATHGALSGGALATTFTASQGLMLMIPNMYKISGELLPAVFHVGCRSLATHALSIFGDHQDAMACRATGFAMLASDSVQATVDMAIVAHLAAISGSLPVLHMFDGWRTSNEMSTVLLPSYEDMGALVDKDAVASFRARGMNPERPDIRGTAQNPDVYFQNREAPNKLYDAFPAIVEEKMKQVAKLTGRSYNLFDYYGDPEAEDIVVIMGSGALVANEAAEWLNANGKKVGVINVRLFRPFVNKALLDAIPQSAKRIAVFDRTKEPGSQGEPLYQDVATALLTGGRANITLVGGRYGLSSKDFSPSMVVAVVNALPAMKPGQQFTVGITDDVTHLSVPVTETITSEPASMRSYMVYGMGSDGTVGATKQAAAILSDLTGEYVQAYFDYDAKKSGGYTVSSLRMDTKPVTSEYEINHADYIGVHKDSYTTLFDVGKQLKEGATFVLNTSWTPEQINAKFPAKLKRILADRKVKFYTVDAAAIAAKTGLGVRINTIMETVFLKFCGLTDFDKSVSKLKELVAKTYNHAGAELVDKNNAAIDQAVGAITPFEIPADWATAVDAPATRPDGMPEWVAKVAEPCLHRRGDELPVSALSPDGFCPVGETAWEKRTIALNIPSWDPAKCIQCTLCSTVCSHAAIRPVVMTAAEAAAAPAGLETIPAKGQGEIADMRWRIQVYPQDCTGCSACATICPTHALTMEPIAPQLEPQKINLSYTQEKVTLKDGLLPRFTVRGAQLQQPLLQFSGACGGCGETPYVKLLTQLFGERMVVANATGCSSVWGADYPSMPYCANKDGHGPAWGNSLFEDNAEYGLGIALGLDQRRKRLALQLQALTGKGNAEFDKAVSDWVAAMDSVADCPAAAKALRPLMPKDLDASLLVKPSVWAIGGDGWAYDIGYAGLDHVIAQNNDVNLMVMDTECYSNTGGQMSKATPLGCVAKYAPAGKRTVKKDLGRMAMTYGHVYVASISLAANPMQAIKAMQEAEAYPGPSLILAYCPCINHGIRKGMGHAPLEEREAVKSGYWPLWRYNPAAEKPLTIDSAAPDGSLDTFLDGENRYADLPMLDPQAAAKLRPEMADRIQTVYNVLTTYPSKD